MKKKYDMPEELRGQLSQLVLSRIQIRGTVEGLEIARINLSGAIKGILLRQYPELKSQDLSLYNYSIAGNCFYVDEEDAE